MADKVTYDVFRDWMNRPVVPYRSEVLYEPDLKNVYRTRVGGAVQVIVERGDLEWTDATLVCSSLVDPELGMLKYTVTLADGREHTVSEDRIRVRP